MDGKLIITADPVIIEDDKLLVISNNGGNKLPGDYVFEGESLEEACVRKAKEEENLDIEIIKPLHPMIQWKTGENEEKSVLVSFNYLAKLKKEMGIEK